MATKRASGHPMKRSTPKPENSELKRAIEIEKKCYKYGAIVLAVLVVLFVLSKFDLLPHFNGSLRYYNGTVYGKNDSTITAITDRDAHRYFNLGTFTIPDGYTVDSDYTVSSDANMNSWALTKDNDNGMKHVAVQGVGSPADKMYSSVFSMNSIYDDAGIVIETPKEYTVEFGGKQFKAMVTPAQYDEYNRNYNKYGVAYIEASHNCSVLLHVSFSSSDPEAFAADEEFINHLQVAANGVKLK